MSAELPVAVTLEYFENEETGEKGRIEVLERFATIKEAEDFLSSDDERIDPIWLNAGHYGIDAPEEMVNP